MGGKNKGGANGFYFFMLEYQRKHGKGKYPSLALVSPVAGPIWARMSKKEREPYDMMAKNSKDGGRKYTSQGVDVKIIEKQEKEESLKQERMKEGVKKIILNAISNDCLSSKTFYIMHMNYFCQHTETKKYFPAEVAICRFSLEFGVSMKDVYHSIIHPGPLPLGYSYEAKNFSENTHLLDIPGSSGPVKDNTGKVFDQILDFMSKHRNHNKYPPIFATNRNMPVVENVLNEWGIDDSIMFDVYSLEYFLYMLRNNVGNGTVWPAISLSEQEIEKDVYDFTTGIACEFHDSSDVPFHCSQSHVIRYVYIICDNCCRDLDIELISGQHVPKKSNTNHSTLPNGDSNSFMASSAHSAIACSDDYYERVENLTLNDYTDSEIETKHTNASNRPLKFVDFENDDGEWQMYRKGKNRKYDMSQGSSLGFHALGQDDSSVTTFEDCSVSDTTTLSQDSVRVTRTHRNFKITATSDSENANKRNTNFPKSIRGRYPRN